MEVNLWHCQLKIGRSLRDDGAGGDSSALSSLWTPLCISVLMFPVNCGLGGF